ncbi:MAG: recombinase family protein [Actinomycetota bacterium]|nr:recombinase family protein [Actinomycetota bacterium]
MLEVQVAIYARVSSEQQAEAHTIASQVAALRERVAADGFRLHTDHEFIDEGYSGASLVRPALESLRDLAVAGDIDRLYVHSPDRLARKYAYQVLLLEELRRAGVEVVFLNRELGRTPEDDLLLQVQGMVAEYERAKILERSRRGKRHAAKEGVVSVLSCAPYGYRYVSKQDGGGQARFEVVLDEARVVRLIFEWVGRERVSIGEVCRRLNKAGERTPRDKAAWSRSTIWGILRNPAYMGLAAFGKTQSGALRPRLRAQRGRQLQPKRAVSTYDQAAEEWIGIPVPAIVAKDLFEMVQGQLDENRQRAREGQRGARYLLQGLVVCPLCGYAYYGKAISLKAAKGQVRDYAYYRCVGSDAYRFGGQRLCDNRQVRTDRLDEVVWQKVRDLLEEPERLVEEYQRRLQNPGRDRQGNDLATVEAQIRKIRQGIGRLIDSYTEGFIERGDFEPRVGRLRERVAVLEVQAQEIANEATLQSELRLLIGRLEDFAATVRDSLDEADWNTRRAIIRTLVKRVEIDRGQVNVVFRVTPGPPVGSSDAAVMQDCTRGDLALAGERLPALVRQGVSLQGRTGRVGQGTTGALRR